MALLETSGFDTGEIRRALDEYDRMEYKRSLQMGAIFIQSMRLLEDAGRLYEENDKLRELVRVAHGCKTDDGCCEDCWGDYGECPIETEMKELGIEVPE